MTVPGALKVIADLVRRMPDLVVGAGTVLDVEVARQSVDAGATFVTSPGFNPRVVEFAIKEGIVVLPGALTPTEVTAAWQVGADFVKVFPCGQQKGLRTARAGLDPRAGAPIPGPHQRGSCSSAIQAIKYHGMTQLLLAESLIVASTLRCSSRSC
jgi:2-keto-3-deoxy-6-phosphogluconate aldolase